MSVAQRLRDLDNKYGIDRAEKRSARSLILGQQVSLAIVLVLLAVATITRRTTWLGFCFFLVPLAMGFSAQLRRLLTPGDQSAK